ncbi:LacI family DNA-binding transcriptional regulator [Aquimarina algiphila]|uniref:LacI family DNA-binding transcriptional regulator n=1 Tax=Aquimarina algiphila TaxID=2047982 RepID=UPI00249172A8|nr:LacI family DNA-binding transcriptional regulator [Aquimarina algiphila]
MFNVSVAAVSKVLRDSHEISSSTKEKTQQYSKKHDYQPNSIALSSMNKKTKAVGVILPTLLNHFFVKFFSGIEQFANERGYNIIIIVTNGSLEKEVESTKMFEKGTSRSNRSLNLFATS